MVATVSGIGNQVKYPSACAGCDNIHSYRYGQGQHACRLGDTSTDPDTLPESRQLMQFTQTSTIRGAAAYCYTEDSASTIILVLTMGTTPMTTGAAEIAANKLEKASRESSIPLCPIHIAFRHGDGRYQDLADGG